MRTTLVFILLCSSCALAVDVSGVVVDSKSGTAVDGAQVSAAGDEGQKTVITDGRGTFILPLRADIGVGTVIRIRVEKKGYVTWDENIAVAPSLPRPIRLAPTPGKSSLRNVHRSLAKVAFKDAPRVYAVSQTHHLGRYFRHA